MSRGSSSPSTTRATTSSEEGHLIRKMMKCTSLQWIQLCWYCVQRSCFRNPYTNKQEPGAQSAQLAFFLNRTEVLCVVPVASSPGLPRLFVAASDVNKFMLDFCVDMYVLCIVLSRIHVHVCTFVSCYYGDVHVCRMDRAHVDVDSLCLVNIMHCCH